MPESNTRTHPYLQQDHERDKKLAEIPPPFPVPSCRRTVNLTFSPVAASLTDEDTQSFHESAEVKSAEDILCNTVAGLTLTASVRVCPPLSKQHRDVQLLLDEHRAVLRERGGAVVYLLDLAWWQQWVAQTQHGTAEPLPAIDNHSLLAAPSSTGSTGDGPEGDTWLPLRPALAVAPAEMCGGLGDCVAVSTEAWVALRSWYGGGPPLPRVQTRGAGGRDDDTFTVDLYPSAPITPGNAHDRLTAALKALADADADEEEGAPPPLALTRAVSAESLARFKSLSLAEVSAGAADCGNNVTMVGDPADPAAPPRRVEVRKICFVCKVRPVSPADPPSQAHPPHLLFVQGASGARLDTPSTPFHPGTPTPFASFHLQGPPVPPPELSGGLYFAHSLGRCLPGPVDDALLQVQGRLLLQVRVCASGQGPSPFTNRLHCIDPAAAAARPATGSTATKTGAQPPPRTPACPRRASRWVAGAPGNTFLAAHPGTTSPPTHPLPSLSHARPLAARRMHGRQCLTHTCPRMPC